MKTTKLLYWIPTVIIFLFEGVMPALTGHTEAAKEGIRHLGYPEYFGTLLVVFKVGGSVLLIIPRLPHRIKEWVYAGFAFDFIFAFSSLLLVDGFGALLILPAAFMILLVISYVNYNKLAREHVTMSTARG